MSAFRLLLAVHIAAGSAALLLLWIPLVARKGGKLHRRVGWAYVVAMGIVAATALGLAGIRLTNSDSRDDFAGFFLGHVAILTAKNIFAGMRALRHGRPNRARKNEELRGSTPFPDIVVSVALVLSSVGMTFLALGPMRVLPLVFAGLGFASAGSEFAYLLKGRTQQNAWLFRHLSNMVASGIAAITAFFVVNAGRFGLGRFNVVVWILPGALGALGIAAWAAYYRRRLTGRAGAIDRANVAAIAVAPR